MANLSRDKKLSRDIVGLVPAAGQASRIAPLPCSKELYPIGFRNVDGVEGLRPKVVSHYLLEKMCLAGVRKAYIILRQGKWDIPSYFGDGTMVDMNLGYLMMRLPFGTPYTLDQAYSFVRHSVIVFGFPDILFEGDDAFVRLLDRLDATEANVVLGVFPVKSPWTMDMVELGNNGEVRSIVIKPPASDLEFGWIIAVWTPVFTEFLHEHLLSLQRRLGRDSATGLPHQSELSVGHVFQAALHDGLQFQAVRFPDRSLIDIGTPQNLEKAVYDLKFRMGLGT
jgi:glucose-1-phosphate thymidylyltransferase